MSLFIKAGGGKQVKKEIIFDSEGQEWGVSANMELYICQGQLKHCKENQRCYSGKLADSQDHLDLIMACVCTSTHKQTHISI